MIVGDIATGRHELQTSPAQTNRSRPATKTLRYTFNRGSNPSTDLVTFTYTGDEHHDQHASRPATITLTVNWALCTSTCQR